MKKAFNLEKEKMKTFNDLKPHWLSLLIEVFSFNQTAFKAMHSFKKKLSTTTELNEAGTQNSLLTKRAHKGNFSAGAYGILDPKLFK